MKCPNCGNEINESYDYCPRCGAKIKVSQSALKEQIEETRHNERFGWILIIVSVVIAAVGLIVGTITSSYFAIGILVVSFIVGVIGIAYWAYNSDKRKKLLRQLNNIER